VRSWLLLALFASAFLLLCLGAHRRGRELYRNERAAVRNVERLHAEGTREEREEGGYRFRWIEGEGMPALLLAEPAEYGTTGTRTFARADEPMLLERDPILRPGDRDPGERRLRAWLALPEAERRSVPLPYPWRLLPRGP